MAKYLVIVESPAKVKTIKKFLGKNYEVVASNGHVRDLPKSQLGIDVEHDYEPKYITIRGKGDILANLRKEVKKADKVYLATDPDREGEAISWHLSKALIPPIISHHFPGLHFPLRILAVKSRQALFPQILRQPLCSRSGTGQKQYPVSVFLVSC